MSPSMSRLFILYATFDTMRLVSSFGCRTLPFPGVVACYTLIRYYATVVFFFRVLYNPLCYFIYHWVLCNPLSYFWVLCNPQVLCNLSYHYQVLCNLLFFISGIVKPVFYIMGYYVTLSMILCNLSYYRPLLGGYYLLFSGTIVFGNLLFSYRVLSNHILYHGF